MIRGLLLAALVLLAGRAMAQPAPPPSLPLHPTTITSKPVSADYTNGSSPLLSTALRSEFYDFTGALQVRVGASQSATEFVSLFGGVVGAGATVRSDSDSAASPQLNLLAKGAGAVVVGNDNGDGLLIINNAAATTSLIVDHATIMPSPSGVGGTGRGAVVLGAAGTDGTIDIVLQSKGTNGSLLNRIADSTATGGNNPGPQVIDIQYGRSSATQVANGTQSTILGGANNTASNTRSTVIGSFGSISSGSNAFIAGGNNASDLGRFGWHGHALGIFAVPGDAQVGEQTFRGVSTSGAAVRLTSNASAADGTSGTRNCNWMATNSAQALNLQLVAVNFTTTAHTSAWFNTALLAEGANAAATTLTLGTATTLGTDVQTVSVTADTSIGCMNVTVTPPNTDTWHYVMRVAGPEVK